MPLLRSLRRCVAAVLQRCRPGRGSKVDSKFMRSLINFVNSRLRQMPRGLVVFTRVFFLFAVLLPIFVVFILLSHGQGSRFTINGSPASYDEFRRQGGIVWFFIFSIYSAVNVYGLIHASRWSRPLLLLPVVSLSILAFIHHATFSAADWLSQVLTIGLMVWYLFFRQTVRDYYANIHKSEA
jgi:hypothetical protein